MPCPCKQKVECLNWRWVDGKCICQFTGEALVMKHSMNEGAQTAMTNKIAGHLAHDTTYDRKVIDANPIFSLAFMISEFWNDDAPIGWSAYIPLAVMLYDTYDIKPKVRHERSTDT